MMTLGKATMQLVVSYLLSKDLDAGARLAAQKVYDRNLDMVLILTQINEWNEARESLNDLVALSSEHPTVSSEALRMFATYYEYLVQYGRLPEAGTARNELLD